MPANIMSALAGSSLKVIGSSIATVSAGPMPGSTPTAVPMVTPMSAHIRLAGVSASPNPPIRDSSPPISEPPRPGRQGQPDEPVEEQEDDPGEGPAISRRTAQVRRA